MSEEGQDTGAGSSGAGVEPAAAASSTSGDRVSALWRQLKEHRIAQWAIGYVALIFAIQHAVTLITEAFEWPHLVVRVSMLLLVLGLPIVMALAWYHGEQASRSFSRAEFSILAVLLCTGALLFYVFVRPEGAPTAPAAVAAKVASESVPAKAASASIPAPSGPSVAVLPFINMSDDPKEEYFSDGMTEEITSALANVKGLKVVARTSAFAFKGKNEDVRAIGRALSATEIIEGSVRKEGNEVRITAQLVRADTGDHLWTQSYDRELKDVFAVQEDIARAIAGALQVPLGLKQVESLVSNRDIDPESYQNYLRAEALFRLRGTGTPTTATIALLQQVVARQPNYAPAWSLLARNYDVMANDYNKGSVEELRRVVNESKPKAEAAAHRAIQLDPRNALAYAVLGRIQGERSKPLDAEQSFKQALSLDPSNSETLQQYGTFLALNGRIKEAVGMREQLRTLDPLVPVFNSTTALILSVAGDNVQALAIADALPSDYRARAQIIALIDANMGQYKEAADAILNAPRDLYPPGVVETAARLLRMAPTTATDKNISDLGSLDWVFAYVGLPERALEIAERDIDAGYSPAVQIIQLWHPDFAAVRKTDRFKALVQKMGLVDYWRAKGWPDLCHPTTGDDFVCN